MKIYGAIPARSGSKGVKDKNIRLVGGIPLIFHSIKVSEKSKCIDRTILTTDSEHYANLTKNFSESVQVVMRPGFLSTDNSKDVDYLLHVSYTLGFGLDDLIVLLRPTTPIRTHNAVDRAILNFRETRYHSLRSMHKINEPPEKMYRIGYRDEATPYMKISHEEADAPRQNFGDCYHPNGYVDVIRVKTLLETKTTYGSSVMAFRTKPAIEIDSEEDFEYLEYTLRKRNS